MSKQQAASRSPCPCNQHSAITGAAAAQPPTHHRNASVQSQRQAVAGAPRDVASTRAVRWNTAQQGGPHGERTGEGRSPHGSEQPPGHGGGEDATPAKTSPRRKPSYVPPSQKRRGQPPQDGSVPEGRPGEPPRGSRPPSKKDDGTGGSTHPQPHAHSPPAQHPPTSPGSNLHGGLPSWMILASERRKRQPVAFCFTACCILFWLLVIIVGVAMLVVYLIYRPQPPRLRVTSATLNAGYISELGSGGMALNYDLTVLAAISNPNTMIHIVLYYMQLDLYFHGRLIGKQAVWPAPVHEGPGYSVLRSVHLVVSEVTMTQEDVMVWQNATAKGGPVKLHLYGRFHTQLNFGRWLPFKYWVSPRCTLWLDPPPSGALRRARC